MKPSQLFVLLLCAVQYAVAAEVPRSGNMLANTCAGCHGTYGHSAGELMPSIGGMDKRYITKAMMDFRSGARPSTIMERIAKGYSEQEIAAIASFFSQKEWRSASENVNSRLAAQGQEIHEAQCESCHADGGRSGRNEVPRLAGQWQPYLYMQLRDLHDIDYEGIQPLEMRERVQKLSHEELEALSHYYASQN
ncbi:MAG: c-type cytochrome [Gammaproteobacteria bacterium]